MKLLGGLVMLSGSQALDRNFNPDRPRVAGKMTFIQTYVLGGFEEQFLNIMSRFK